MSKHWTPRIVPRTGRGGSRRGSATRKRRRKTVFTTGEIRLALLGGILAGLTYVLMPWTTPEIVPVQAGASAELMPDGPAIEGPIAANPGTLRIIDGDTFHYGGQKIRIADIDTPELRGRCAYETQLAARAARRMAQLLRQGPFELRSVGRDEDRYGRKLRVVTRGGRSLGDQLVSEGLARTWTGRREPWCA